MITRLVFVMTLVAVALGGRAASAAEDPYVAGNAAAVAGDHAASAAAFEQAIAADGWSAGALLGLGNAYAAAGQHSRAILAFERARLIDPRDAAIATNLARVRDAAGIAEPRPHVVARTIGMLTADEWSWIAIGGGSLAGVGFVVAAWSRRRRIAMTLILAGAAVSAVTAGAAAYVAPRQDRAIVITPEAARIAPAASAEAAFTPAGGEAVEVVKQHGTYVLVRDEGRSGWLPASAVERVVRERS